MLLWSQVNAHSWVEQLPFVTGNDSSAGGMGFPRGNVPRTDPSFRDDLMSYIIPPVDRPIDVGIQATDLMCKASQQPYNQTKNSPRLTVPLKSSILFWYQENGHVTLPQSQAGKPENRGTVDVHHMWKPNTTEDGQRGQLLGRFNFDDGQCYQVNNGSLSKSRQDRFPHRPVNPMEADLWCHNTVELPKELQAGDLFTFYWVWDWPTAPNVDVNYPDGKSEVYTTCIDIDIISKPLPP
ncbi:MAG: hypothetical protein M1837_006408 [Sclerophora amabilis]|nr:MAG: hypothetical protein M1837_006408 [Sclerophora amabilis]